jgi:hypothetical protein
MYKCNNKIRPNNTNLPPAVQHCKQHNTVQYTLLPVVLLWRLDCACVCQSHVCSSDRLHALPTTIGYDQHTRQSHRIQTASVVDTFCSPIKTTKDNWVVACFVILERECERKGERERIETTKNWLSSHWLSFFSTSAHAQSIYIARIICRGPCCKERERNRNSISPKRIDKKQLQLQSLINFRSSDLLSFLFVETFLGGETTKASPHITIHSKSIASPCTTTWKAKRRTISSTNPILYGQRNIIGGRGSVDSGEIHFRKAQTFWDYPAVQTNSCSKSTVVILNRG